MPSDLVASLAIELLLGVPLGLVYANVGEWLVHRYLLHGLGKKKGTYWSFHFHEHHRASRKNAMIDPDYERFAFGAHAQGKEVWGLVGSAVAHAPLVAWVPGFVLGVWLYIAWYYRVHRLAHEVPGWARENLPWHYEHHMGRDQDQNWGVVAPWTDLVLGTRQRYIGTPEEARYLARQAKRARRRAAEAARRPCRDA